ncbi:MAG: hypothetical protein JO152_00245 [Mycobacteriaceae bacterium]|nr:hypothetical protein [Mycobacteriaceae bacterium]
MMMKVIAAVASACAATTLGVVDVARADTEYNFQSPSGNIACMLGDVLNGGVECDVADFTYVVPPRPTDCGPTHFGDRFALWPGQPARMQCHGDTVRVPGMQTLAYGHSVSLGQISCDSEPAGMRCVDASTGHYFRAARDSFELG